MNLHSILVHVDGMPRASARIEVALELAAAHGGRVTGLFVKEPAVDGKTPEEGAATWSTQLAFNAERTFRRLAEGGRAPAQWFSASGDLLQAVTFAARLSDLLVLGQGGENACDMPARVAAAAGRPVLVVPRAGTFPAIGRRVLVAWSDTREATRALHDALPILASAHRTVLLLVNPAEDEGRSEARLDIGDLLSAHGIKATIVRSFANRVDIGRTILGRAREDGADLVVMGARADVALGRLKLGGTTEHVLANATLPVLISS